MDWMRLDLWIEWAFRGRRPSAARRRGGAAAVTRAALSLWPLDLIPSFVAPRGLIPSFVAPRGLIPSFVAPRGLILPRHSLIRLVARRGGASAGSWAAGSGVMEPGASMRRRGMVSPDADETDAAAASASASFTSDARATTSTAPTTPRLVASWCTVAPPVAVALTTVSHRVGATVHQDDAQDPRPALHQPPLILNSGAVFEETTPCASLS